MGFVMARKKNRDYGDRRIVPCQTPTDAMPGSPVKVQIMAARNERGETIFHPDDASDTSTVEIAQKSEGFTIRQKRGRPPSRFQRD